MCSSRFLLASSLVVAAQATSHYMIVGSFSASSLYTIEYDDSSSALTLAANTSAGAHQWISLSHDKKNIYGAGSSRSMSVDSYTIVDPTNIVYNTTTVAGSCEMNVVHLEACPAEPYSVYSVTYTDVCGGVNGVDEQGVIVDNAQNFTFANDSSLHGNGFHPTGSYMYTADMGAESVWTHSINHETGEITVVLEDKIEGHEPRHVVAHPSGKYAYAMTEPTSSVIELSVDNSTGAATHTGAIYGIVPANASGTHRGETARVSATGTILYATTRANASDASSLDGFVSGFTLDADGKILSQDFIEATNTGGGKSNMVVPTTWDDNLFIIIDAINGNIEMWQRADDGSSASTIATLELGDTGVANGVWLS